MKGIERLETPAAMLRDINFLRDAEKDWLATIEFRQSPMSSFFMLLSKNYHTLLIVDILRVLQNFPTTDVFFA